MSSTHNRAGDGSLTLVNAIYQEICNEIKELDLQDPDSMLRQIKRILTYVLRTPVNYSPRRRQRDFPQVFDEESTRCIRYFTQKTCSSTEKSAEQKNILFQVSTATVILCCPIEFIREKISFDETFSSFSEKWPMFAKMSNDLYDLILSKVEK